VIGAVPAEQEPYMSQKNKKLESLHLAEIPLFRSLPAEEIDQLFQRYKTWDAPAGTLVLEEGQPGDEFYVILTGLVEIVRALGSAEESHLGIRQPGEFIGEIGLLTQGAPRTATARVIEDAQLLTITYADFNELLKTHPELPHEMAIVLSERHTDALDRTIHNLRDKNEKLQQAYDELRMAQAKIIEKEKLEHSLQVARKIQYSILPTKIPQMDGYDIGALMVPALAVGGDFYGVYVLDEYHMALIIGDVSDKGMPAAIFMAQSHALLRASLRNDVSTKQALERVNSLLREMNAEGLFVTVLYGILNTVTGEFSYTRAGHELPLVLDPKNNVSFPTEGKGIPLGLFDTPPLDEQTITIPAGGCMLLYTDGPADTCNQEGLRFGVDRLIQVVQQFGNQASAQQTCQAIYDAIVDFKQEAAQFDDVTLVAVRRLL
jgi:serine phosphatase RsbU (regulator of sigma subunit)